MSDAALAVVIFLIVYASIVIERVPRAVSALAGAAAVILLGVVDQEAAIEAIDFNTIGLLVGMMIVVAVLKRTGLFEMLGIVAARAARGRAGLMIVYFSTITALASALLDNVTTVLLMVPISVSVAKSLHMNPIPLVVAQILASNVGGTATLVGDPPNIMIGSASGLGFVDFLVNLAPLIFGLVFPVTLVLLYLAFRKSLRRGAPSGVVEAAEARSEAGAVPGSEGLAILRADPRTAIKDARLLRSSLIVLCLVFVGFGLHQWLHLESATIALAGAALMLLISRLDVEELFNDVEWSTIFFFVGLFVVVGALEHTGVIAALAQLVLEWTAGDRLLTVLMILWGAALASAFIDNIPFTATMIPLILDIERTTGVDVAPYWWALSLGACLGGNGTLIGASANVVASDLLREAGYPITYARFFKVAFPITIVTVVVSMVYVLTLEL